MFGIPLTFFQYFKFGTYTTKITS